MDHRGRLKQRRGWLKEHRGRLKQMLSGHVTRPTILPNDFSPWTSTLTPPIPWGLHPRRFLHVQRTKPALISEPLPRKEQCYWDIVGLCTLPPGGLFVFVITIGHLRVVMMMVTGLQMFPIVIVVDCALPFH